jgi:branched-chain amino acid transport system ATP-binding protein
MTVLLEVRELSRAFGGIRAVDSVGFEVLEGEWVGIAGPNGAGKSPLLNCISGVAGRTEGQVIFRGADITGLNPSRIGRSGIGRAFQTVDRFSDCTVGDFVALGRLAARNASVWKSMLTMRSSLAKERAARAAAHDALIRFDLARYEHMRMRETAYGVRKMIDVVRVIVAEPVLMLLDEPTSGSSAHERGMLREMMASLRGGGTTALVVDHDIGFLSACSDRVVAMAAGRKIAEGPPSDVFADPDVVRSYLGEQTSGQVP